ncbi:phage tail tape measure protein, lambda family [Faunimonas pinastri]|uniref:Phage tail tape measure protein, lambda family n=1 Tax=Faunimonas pinastri TaxID=1855383 RepID=A0A1H9M8Y0_9HYPH|nr:phage tail tape measure protein [Faunimonas pinastri]SER19887.1 phage tail tape measure protein, lambda family [Faunimonas pinastri]
MADDSVDVGVNVDTKSLQDSLSGLQGVADTFGKSMTKAFSQSVTEGKKLDDVVKSVGERLSSKALTSALQPISSGISTAVTSILGGITGTAFAKGGVVSKFASGGVVSSPTVFPMGSGVGLMGEAGSEAIMPLTRGSDGSLGVRTAGGGTGSNVTFNVTTRDADSFRRSQTDLSAMLVRTMKRGQRGL